MAVPQPQWGHGHGLQEKLQDGKQWVRIGYKTPSLRYFVITAKID